MKFNKFTYLTCPYKIGSKVIINPLYHNNTLHVANFCIKNEGKIIGFPPPNVEVLWENNENYFFFDRELIIVK